MITKKNAKYFKFELEEKSANILLGFIPSYKLL